MRIALILKTVIISSLFLFHSHILPAQELVKKWYPGHYLYASPKPFLGSMVSEYRDLVKDNPYFRGYHCRYWWVALEKSKGVYDFSIIEKDIETARADGKKLIVHIHDRDHVGQTLPIPEYLTTDPVYEGGYYRCTENAYPKYMPKLWVPAVAERWGELLKALGRKFDQDTILAYVCMEETSLVEAANQPGFSSAKLRDGYKIIYSAAAEGLPNTLFSQYANWPGGLTREDADDMMKHLVSLRHGMGGPDALNARKPFDGVKSIGALDNWFGPYYILYKNIMPVTSSSQANSYKVNDPLKLLDYSINNLNSHFMSWVPYTKESDKYNLFGIDEVIQMVTAEKGRINTTPPANILSSFNPGSLPSNNPAGIDLNSQDTSTAIQNTQKLK
jgi:hypothetical protein